MRLFCFPAVLLGEEIPDALLPNFFAKTVNPGVSPGLPEDIHVKSSIRLRAASAGRHVP